MLMYIDDNTPNTARGSHYRVRRETAHAQFLCPMHYLRLCPCRIKCEYCQYYFNPRSYSCAYNDVFFCSIPCKDGYARKQQIAVSDQESKRIAYVAEAKAIIEILSNQEMVFSVQFGNSNIHFIITGRDDARRAEKLIAPREFEYYEGSGNVYGSYDLNW